MFCYNADMVLVGRGSDLRQLFEDATLKGPLSGKSCYAKKVLM